MEFKLQDNSSLLNVTHAPPRGTDAGKSGGARYLYRLDHGQKGFHALPSGGNRSVPG
ncbi:hypothetical protein HMPREF7215_2255 [Pyramidobacter piscolens W5455]|uniref:Uncharacterized protein n=1 Tax=Pyramidobacter piscolens W5455 TaxID=352165 RepID=A0ABP2HSR4_9BACT|nr:hypothetical protein HMPREF7215_2255 [Pyramidobacter piscolens W5455]